MIILPAVAESGERLVPLCRCAMKQANVVHRITAAGLVIDPVIYAKSMDGIKYPRVEDENLLIMKKP